MAIALSIFISLIAGVTIMFENKYFWGKEDNQNIATINASITNFNSVVSIVPMVIILVVALGLVMLVCTMRGF